jgi:NADPH:quinone reductase
LSEVSLSGNADLDNAVVGNGAVIAAYATRADRPTIPFWPMLFNNVTLRLMGGDDFPMTAKVAAAHDLTDDAA